MTETSRLEVIRDDEQIKVRLLRDKQVLFETTISNEADYLWHASTPSQAFSLLLDEIWLKMADSPQPKVERLDDGSIKGTLRE